MAARGYLEIPCLTKEEIAYVEGLLKVVTLPTGLKIEGKDSENPKLVIDYHQQNDARQDDEVAVNFVAAFLARNRPEEETVVFYLFDDDPKKPGGYSFEIDRCGVLFEQNLMPNNPDFLASCRKLAEEVIENQKQQGVLGFVTSTEKENILAGKESTLTPYQIDPTNWQAMMKELDEIAWGYGRAEGVDKDQRKQRRDELLEHLALHTEGHPYCDAQRVLRDIRMATLPPALRDTIAEQPAGKAGWMEGLKGESAGKPAATHTTSPIGPIAIPEPTRDKMARMTNRELVEKLYAGPNFDPFLFAEAQHRRIAITSSKEATLMLIVEQEILRQTPPGNAAVPPIKSLKDMSPKERIVCEWNFLRKTLEDAQKRLEALSGGRAGWMGPAIDICRERAKEEGAAIDSDGPTAKSAPTC